MTTLSKSLIRSNSTDDGLVTSVNVSGLCLWRQDTQDWKKKKKTVL